MYTIIQIAIIVAAGLIGLVMTVCPQKIVKKEWREDEAKLKKNRVLGIIIIILCVMLLFML